MQRSGPRLQSVPSSTRRRSLDLDQQAETDAEEANLQRQAREERASLCESARDRLERYETAHRLYRPLEDGEREYLSDEELDAERAAARQSVDEWCD